MLKFNSYTDRHRTITETDKEKYLHVYVQNIVKITYTVYTEAIIVGNIDETISLTYGYPWIFFSVVKQRWKAFGIKMKENHGKLFHFSIFTMPSVYLVKLNVKSILTHSLCALWLFYLLYYSLIICTWSFTLVNAAINPSRNTSQESWVRARARRYSTTNLRAMKMHRRMQNYTKCWTKTENEKRRKKSIESFPLFIQAYVWALLHIVGFMYHGTYHHANYSI